MFFNFIALIGLSHVVLSDEDCTFVVSGKQYDLSALKSQSISGPDSKVSTYSYNVAVCGDHSDTCDDIMTGERKNGNVYQIGGEPGSTVCWDVLAKWDSTVKAGPLDSTSGASSGTDGLTLSFSNGDSCRNTARATKINLVCDPQNTAGSVTGFQDASDSCMFVINYETSHACAEIPKTTPNPANCISGISCGGSSGPPWNPNSCLTNDQGKFCCCTESGIYCKSESDCPVQTQRPTTTQPSLSPTTTMPSQAPTYYGPQITVEIEYYEDAGCTEKSTDEPNNVEHAPKDICISTEDPDWPDDFQSVKAVCDGDGAMKYTTYNHTHCRTERESQTLKIDMCTVISFFPDHPWGKVVKIDGCGSAKKSEDSFFNTEHILLIAGGGLMLVLIIVFAIYYFGRKKQDGTSGYSTMQQ